MELRNLVSMESATLAQFFDFIMWLSKVSVSLFLGISTFLGYFMPKPSF